MNPVRRSILSIILLCLVILFGRQFNYTFEPAKAQSGMGSWSVAKQIPNYDPVGRAPVMAADQQGQIHAFNDQRVGVTRDMVIYYRTWNLEQGWTTPVDIIYRGRLLNSIAQDALVDEWGTLHLLFFEGDPNAGTLQHASAPASEARQARSWSRPGLVVEGAGPISSAVLLSLRRDNLTVLFSGQVEGYGLYMVHSDDQGVTWSEPETIYLTGGEKQWVAAIRADVDESGRLHVVWGVVNDDGTGDAVYYARFIPETDRWDQLTTLATREGSDYSTTWPDVIVDEDGRIIVVYMDSFPATKFFRVSKDGGETWSVPVRPFPHEGEYEHPVLLKDSNNVVHMVLGNRTPGNLATGALSIHGMWHSIWQNERWSDLRPIVTGPKTIYFDPSAPKGVISMGNTILASWWHDTSNEYRSGAWYSYVILDAPELPVSTPLIPTLTPTATSRVTEAMPEAEKTLTPTAVNPDGQEDKPRTGGSTNSSTILFSLIPVFLLFSAIIIYRRLTSESHQS